MKVIVLVVLLLASQLILAPCANDVATSPCATCTTGPGSTTCATCISGKFVVGTDCTGNCLANCGTCVDATTCTTCSTGYFKSTNGATVTCVQTCPITPSQFATTTANGPECVTDANCPVGTFANTATRTCTSCSASCDKCTSSQACTQCKATFQLYAPPGTTNKGCVAACPTGTVSDGAAAPGCVACPNNCNTCTFAIPPVCTVCTSGYFLYTANGQPATCVFICPDGFYSDSASKTCMACSDTNCARCSSTGTCSKCKPTFFLNAASTCQTCSTGCSTCASTGVCQVCSTGYVLNTVNSASSTCLACVDSNCQTCKVVPPAVAGNQPTTECLTCKPNFFLTGTNTCTNCVNGCDICTSISRCSQCTSPNFKQIGASTDTCTPNCAPTTFANTTSGVCTNCLPKCSTCSSDKTCNVCISGYYKQSFVDGRPDTCLSCLPGCSTCKDGLTCDTCAASTTYRVLPQTGSVSAQRCETACPTSTATVGYSALAVQTDCQTCPQGCKACTSDTVCTGCLAGFYLNLGKCKPCPNNCLCSESSTDPYTCPSCASPSFLLRTKSTGAVAATTVSGGTPATPGTSGDVTNPDQCLSACPAGFFGKTTNNLNSCLPCDEGCTACTTAANVCQGCKPGYFKDSTAGSSDCFKCDANCATCTSATVCTACINGKTQPTSANAQTCTATCACKTCTGPITTGSTDAGVCASCNDGFFFDSVGKVCTACTTSCKICTSANVCTTCMDTFFKKPSATTPPVDSCVTCGSTQCKTCSSDAANSCLTCLDSFFLANGACSSTACDVNCVTCASATKCQVCKQGTYLKADGSCGLCTENSPACSTCTSATVCTSCNPLPISGVAQPPSQLFLNGAGTTADPIICVGTCPAGFFDSATSAGVRSCTACSVSCKTCTSATVCSICQAGFFLSSGSCTRCPNNCNTCTSATTCSICDVGFYRGIINNVQNCFAQCPEATFPSTVTPVSPDLQTQVCTACDTNCLRCTAATAACTLCKSGYFLNVGMTCIVTCPDGSFAEPLSRTCVDRCPSGLVGITTSKTCVATCPLGFFTGDNQICTTCPANCSTCLNAQSCSLCNIGFRLLPGALATDPKTCVQTCPDRFFTSITGRDCIACPTDCQQCSRADTCNSCLNGKFVQLDVVTRKQYCTVSCLPGYFNAQTKCIQCLEGCKQCSGPTTCIACSDGGKTITNVGLEVIIKPRFYLNIAGQTPACVENCPPRFFADTLSKSCISCFTDCNRCISGNTCLQCKSGTFLQSGPNGADSLCLPDCPARQLRGTTGRCEPCLDGCIACSKPNVCDICDSGKFLGFGPFGDNSQCGINCPPSFFPDPQQNICRKCPLQCKTCDSIEKCTACIPNLFLQLASDGVRSVCGQFCPPGTFADSSKSICTSCSIQGCAVCDNATTCTQCQNGLFLFRDGTSARCIAACPDDMIISSTGECLPPGQRCKSCEYLRDNEKRCKDCPSRFCKAIKVCRKSPFCRFEITVPCFDTIQQPQYFFGS